MCVRQKHVVVCGQLCLSSSRYIIPMEHRIGVLSTKLHRHDDFHEYWVWLDVKEVESSHASVDKKLATHDVSNIRVSVMPVKMAMADSREKREVVMTLNQPKTPYKTAELFF